MSREVFARFDKEARCFASKSGEKNYFNISTGPYEYLLGALSGCFYYTIRDVIDGSITYDSIEMHIEGVKRETSPTTLEKTKVEVFVKNPSNFESFKESVIKASSICSIYQTIKCVSEMELIICQSI